MYDDVSTQGEGVYQPSPPSTFNFMDMSSVFYHFSTQRQKAEERNLRSKIEECINLLEHTWVQEH